MARGPYQGSFQPNLRPTVVTAPDAVVYINGDTEVIGCPQCSRSFDVNKYLTSVQVDLSVESVPGSASLSLAVPRHAIDDFYFDGNPVITPMMEIEIYTKGYYLLEGIPQYYPIFWGVVTEVTDAYSSGAHTLSIHCADILKWWEVCKMNINPAYTAPKTHLGRSLFGNVFAGMNPYDVIWSLALQSYGDVLIGTGSLVSSYKEQAQKQTFDVALADIMLYWEQRFQKIRNNVLLYGVNGKAVRGDALYNYYTRSTKGGANPPKYYVSNAVRNANGGKDAGQMVFDPTAQNVTAFRTQFQNAGQINFWQSEYQTKLEIANAAKEAIGYEFFMDVDGSIVFKPPFYNLDILSNKPISWIQDIDVIDWDFSESEAEVVTQVVMQGSYGGTVDYGLPEECTPFTSVTDYHLLRKYGWRTQSYNSEFLGDTQLMFYQGLDILDRINSKRHRGTVTIPCRPELRLGYPVYIAPKDQIWYVTGISHNIAFGGRASTTLTLTAKRSKWIAPTGIATMTLSSMNAGQGQAVTPSSSSTAQPNVAAPAQVNSPTTFPYTSRQLSKQATFSVNLGANPAFMPATNSDTVGQSSSNNPYTPIIIRHPQTGRICGYPNAVMVYSRAFAPASSDLDTNQGRKAPGTNPASAKTSQQKITANQQQNFANEQQLTIDADYTRLKEKHSTNRYTYGLTSAGRFIYAQDASNGGVISEILTLPSANVIVSPADQSTTVAAKSQTTLIRPVSDERGFEVVGHFRYGRRVSFTDGSLVLTGNTNTKANIDLQLGLGGGLTEMLTAQSQGLTAISSAFPNAAQTVSTLAPYDLQTAAIVQPDTGTPKFTDTGSNFVNQAPLGTPGNQGTVSVQVSQLSRALTAAEMGIANQSQDPNDTTCPCLLGRSDLAFLNIGYVVGNSPISTATPDQTSLSSSVPGSLVSAGYGSFASSGVSDLQSQQSTAENLVSSLKAQLAAASGAINAQSQFVNPVGYTAALQSVSTLQAKLDQAQSNLDQLNAQLQVVQSTPQASDQGLMPNPDQMQAKIETFLANLYYALDTPHQQLEHSLRGDLLPGGLLTNDPSFPFSSSAPSLAPPYSGINQISLGSTAANAVLSGSSATNDLSNVVQNFGTALKSSAQRAQITGQIAQDQQQLASVSAQLTQLQKAQQQGASVAGVSDVGQAITALQATAGNLQQEIQNLQGQLAQLPPPPA